MRIVWNDYIEEQLHWAERLSAIASEANGPQAMNMLTYAERAMANALAAARDEKVARLHRSRDRYKL